MDNEGDIILRDIEQQDCQKLFKAFSKPKDSRILKLYQSYFNQKELGVRDVIIAEQGHHIVGYVTIVWESNYENFKEEGIPEIKDLKVLELYRQRGIATRLMDEAEKRVAQVAQCCGVGVGLSEIYEGAQHLYTKRGYVPDGKGIFYMDTEIINVQVEVDENQGLMVIKKL